MTTLRGGGLSVRPGMVIILGGTTGGGGGGAEDFDFFDLESSSDGLNGMDVLLLLLPFLHASLKARMRWNDLFAHPTH